MQSARRYAHEPLVSSSLGLGSLSAVALAASSSHPTCYSPGVTFGDEGAPTWRWGLPPRRNTIAMPDTLLRSSGMLVEEKRRLFGREKRLAKAEQRLILGLTRSLSGQGNQVLPVTGPEAQALAARSTRAAQVHTRGR
jgi:hypothetical protein